ncbi:hypothetical protein HXP44_24315 [Streptomyces sioyaensis]|uniref:Uncharacterized protein n=1 Tax=Streptomyces sioyaensis TaxID=67364 RepID=A0A4Q1R014_9ACTN|nr:DUF6082 family protein [Streptomyces sioyaensis]MBM4795096.1 hypothetical protein [Streptomyces sioyaensis]RXS64099.1 hypothetical protein EST54_23370 [Streptomyces sioyaensis]
MIFAAACVVLLALVSAAPFILEAAAPNYGKRWSMLSEIGQTYASISAVLSALAVVGVAYSLVLQAKQARLEKFQAMRTFQRDLLLMAMEDESLRPCWGPMHGLQGQEWRQHTYSRLIMAYLWMGAEAGGIPAASIRANAIEIMKSPPGRDYWQRSRDRWKLDACSARERQFVKIFEEEFQRRSSEP